MINMYFKMSELINKLKSYEGLNRFMYSETVIEHYKNSFLYDYYNNMENGPLINCFLDELFKPEEEILKYANSLILKYILIIFLYLHKINE